MRLAVAPGLVPAASLLHCKKEAPQEQYQEGLPPAGLRVITGGFFPVFFEDFLRIGCTSALPTFSAIHDLENQHPLRNVDVGPIRRSSHRQNTDVVADLALESQSDASERHQGFCRVALRHQRAL